MSSLKRFLSNYSIYQNLLRRNARKNACQWASCSRSAHSYAVTPRSKDRVREIRQKITDLNVEPAFREDQSKVETAVSNGIGIIWFESLNAKTNTLTLDMFSKMVEALEALNENEEVDIIVFRSSKANQFCIGADMKLIRALTPETSYDTSRCLQDFMFYVLACSKPTVAIVDGHCLGAGLELALACTYCVSFEAGAIRFGFPEVTHGILPAGLGTFLAFLKLDHEFALRMLTTGRPVMVKEAKSAGVVSHVCPNIESISNRVNGFGNVEHILSFCKINAEAASQCCSKFREHTPKPFFGQHINNDLLLSYVMNFLAVTAFPLATLQKAKLLSRSYENNPAGLEAISIYKEFLTASKNIYGNVQHLMEVEAKAFRELLSLPSSRALLNLHIINSGANKYLPKLGPGKKVETIGIVGMGGLMGSGIASLCCATEQFKVLGLDTNEELAKKQIANIISGYTKTKINPKMFNSLDSVSGYGQLAGCDLVIEAVPEDLATKQHVVTELEKHVSSDCIIATNTSGIVLADISSVSINPGRIIGMHYFSPVQKMKLLEIVTNKRTSEEALATAIRLGRLQGKVCVVVKDSPGFFTTRVLGSMLAEIIALYDDGYTPNVVDRELRYFGLPMDVSELIDDIGIDVCQKILQYLSEKLGSRFHVYAPNILDFLVVSGYLGKKTYKGIHKYGYYHDRSIISQPSLMCFDYMKRVPNFIKPSLPEAHIIERVILRMINECCKCLEEGIIPSPAVGDIAMVYGLGFPRSCGGPFYYVDHVGVDKVVEDLRELQQQRNIEAFAPCKLLEEMAENGRKFYN